VFSRDMENAGIGRIRGIFRIGSMYVRESRDKSPALFPDSYGAGCDNGKSSFMISAAVC
jgi:hypothetical protein